MRKKSLAKILLAGTMVWTSLTSFSAASTIGTDVVHEAKKYIGYNISSYDTSFFITYVFKKEGIDLPSGLTALSKEGTYIAKKDLQPGDVVFFGTSTSNIIAVGIYSGDNQVIVSYKPYKYLKTISLDSSVAKSYYLGAKRMVSSDPVDESDEPANTTPTDSAVGQKIIEAGMKYLGTPYEYGSSRSTTTTMDCSEFVMWAYRDGANFDIGRGGARTHQAYVKEHGSYTTDLSKLKPGDIMFFMSYEGYKESDYDGIDASKESVTHNGIYMGDGKVLHTYSKESGGVRINEIKDTHWEWRFVGGGSPF